MDRRSHAASKGEPTRASRTLHPAERAHGLSAQSVLWNRNERRWQPPANAWRSCLYKNAGNPTQRPCVTQSAGNRGRDGRARAAARLPRYEKHGSKGASPWPQSAGPPGEAHAPTPSIKHCLNATVQAADYLDGWIRRYVLEHPLRYRPTEFCADQSQPAKGQKPVPAVSRVSASHTADQSRVKRPPRNRAAFVRDRSVWLSLGHCLWVQYDALAAPVPPRIAALVEQLDTQK